jgi:hypothetical protein
MNFDLSVLITPTIRVSGHANAMARVLFDQ